MSAFTDKYPAFTAMLAIVAEGAQDLAAQNITFVAKLESMANLVSPIIDFIPQASGLGAELTALKASPADIEAAAEQLVTDLAFTSAKAKAIIAAAFPLAESAVGMIPQVEALVAAIKS